MFLYYSNNQPLQGIYVIVFIQILLFFVHTWNNNIKKKRKKKKKISLQNITIIFHKHVDCFALMH